MSLDNIPEHFRQRIQEAREQQLEELDLSDGQLNQIPDEVFELTHLLDFGENNKEFAIGIGEQSPINENREEEKMNQPLFSP